MTTPKNEPNTNGKTPNTTQHAPASPSPSDQTQKPALKAITIQVSPETHKRLRVLAVSRGVSASGLVESYLDAGLKRDLAGALAKLGEG